MTKPTKKIKGKPRGKGAEKRKGQSGIAAQYMTRNQAIKKLQITLKDFRRLCILKGIYPRDPKKKKYGKDKTYYHVKDIRYLSHEPLLMKFRDLKIFLKKSKRANMKRDKTRVETLKKNAPTFNLSHLIKERYPSFVDALRDIDDALSMIFLFASLPAKMIRSYSAEMGASCAQLAKEWEYYVATTNSLSKVFVSIKGIYYQAVVHGVTITWLVPHAFKQLLPRDVDYRVMLTFLQFYETLVKFVNFKLFHDINLTYPPNIDLAKLDARAGLNSLRFQSLSQSANNSSTPVSSSSAVTVPVKAAKANPELQKTVSAVVKKLKNKGEPQEEEEVEEEEKMEDDSIPAEFANADAEEEDSEKAQIRKLFAGLTFVLGREVPVESLELLITAAGGKVLFQKDLTAEQISSNTGITHQVMDRPNIVDPVRNREYVQPQWIYDSFNCRTRLPTAPYKPGTVCPPHLSPFVNDEAEGYVPKQKEVLISWGAKLPGATKATNSNDNNDEDMEEEIAEEEVEEQRYEKELQKERKGVKYSEEQKAAAEQEENEDDEEDDEEEGDDDDEVEDDVDDNDLPVDSDDDEDDNNDNDNDNDDDMASDEEDNRPKTKATPLLSGTKSSVKKVNASEKDLARIMMPKKAARLLKKIEYGQDKKTQKVETLLQKRKQFEEEQEANAKSQQNKKQKVNKASRK